MSSVSSHDGFRVTLDGWPMALAVGTRIRAQFAFATSEEVGHPDRYGIQQAELISGSVGARLRWFDRATPVRRIQIPNVDWFVGVRLIAARLGVGLVAFIDFRLVPFR